MSNESLKAVTIALASLEGFLEALDGQPVNPAYKERLNTHYMANLKAAITAMGASVTLKADGKTSPHAIREGAYPEAPANQRDCDKCGMSARGGVHHCEKAKPSEQPDDCRAAFEHAYGGAWGKNHFATFDGTMYHLPPDEESENRYEYHEKLNADWIAFQKGFNARTPKREPSVDNK